MKLKYYIGKIVPIVIVIVSICIAIFPFIWMLFVSIVPDQVTAKFPPDISVKSISISNYIALFTDPDYAGVAVSIRNSLIVAVVSSTLVVFFGLLAAYGFYRFKFWGKNVFYTGILLGRMFPLVSLLVPLYLVLNQLNLINTLAAVIISHTVIFLPLMIWFMRGYMQSSVPGALLDAAKIDGCNDFVVLFRIVAPITIPGIIGLTMLLFIFSWGEYFFASAFVFGSDVMTMPVRLQTIMFSATKFSWSIVMAMGISGAIIPLILGIIFQKQLISGLTAGAGK